MVWIVAYRDGQCAASVRHQGDRYPTPSVVEGPLGADAGALGRVRVRCAIQRSMRRAGLVCAIARAMMGSGPLALHRIDKRSGIAVVD